MFGHPVYFLDRPRLPISILGPHKEFFNGAFETWIDGGKIRWVMHTN